MSQMLSDLLAAASEALGEGDAARAEACCRQVLAVAPQHGDALYFLAEAAEAQGRSDEAIELLGRLQRQYPKEPMLLTRLAQALRRAGLPAEAERYLHKAVKLQPDYLPALGTLGLLAREAGRLDEASAIFQRILRLHPSDPNSLLNLADVQRAQGRVAEARGSLERAIALQPGLFGAHNNLGNLLLAEGDAQGAADAYRRALSLDAGSAGLWLNYGDALRELRQWQDALEAYEQAVRLAPADEAALRQCGLLLIEMHRPLAAIGCFQRLLRLDPHNVKGWNGLTKCLLDIALAGAESDAMPPDVDTGSAQVARVPPDILVSRTAVLEHAIACCDQALAVQADDVAARDNRGLALSALGRRGEAEDSLRAAVAAMPDYAGAHFNLASVCLSQGRYGEGWREYGWRINLSHALDYLEATPGLPAPWHAGVDPVPTELRGRRILVARDQGIGDELFFLRFLPALKARGAIVCYWSSDKLRPLLEDSSYIDEFVGFGEAPGAVDLVVAVGDLPCLLRIADGCALPPPLRLSPDPVAVQRLADMLQVQGGRPLMGVTWRAGPPKEAGVRTGLRKQLSPSHLAQALAAWPGTIVILQRHPAPGEIEAFKKAARRPVLDMSAANDDLAEMLALLDVLDDYVGVSNTNMHLRASLGKPARVLVSHPAEWRWMAHGAQSPWFPAFHLYREDLDLAWEPALHTLAQDLRREGGCR